jgi:hypothetical protein
MTFKRVRRIITHNVKLTCEYDLLGMNEFRKKCIVKESSSYPASHNNKKMKKSA